MATFLWFLLIHPRFRPIGSYFFLRILDTYILLVFDLSRSVISLSSLFALSSACYHAFIDLKRYLATKYDRVFIKQESPDFSYTTVIDTTSKHDPDNETHATEALCHSPVQGDGGFVISHEIFIYLFDGVPMFLVIIILGVAHPGRFIWQVRQFRALR